MKGNKVGFPFYDWVIFFKVTWPYLIPFLTQPFFKFLGSSNLTRLFGREIIFSSEAGKVWIKQNIALEYTV